MTWSRGHGMWTHTEQFISICKNWIQKKLNYYTAETETIHTHTQAQAQARSLVRWEIGIDDVVVYITKKVACHWQRMSGVYSVCGQINRAIAIQTYLPHSCVSRKMMNRTRFTFFSTICAAIFVLSYFYCIMTGHFSTLNSRSFCAKIFHIAPISSV